MDDRAFYDLYIAPRAGAVLAVAVRLGLFAWLAEGPRSAEEIAARYTLEPRPADGFLTALTAMGVLSRTRQGDPGRFFEMGEVYALTSEADRFLVPGREEDLSGLIAMEFEDFITPKGLLEAMRRNAPGVYGAADPWDLHGKDAEKAREFARGMRSISARPAKALAAMDLWKDRTHLVDVGGGSGIYSIEILKQWPHMKATIVEIPAVCPLAEELAKEAGVKDRLTTHPANMFKDKWPEGDALLLSQILHDWPPDKGTDLLNKARASLTDGGLVLVHEKLIDAKRASPLANALVSLDMLFWTEGQQYSTTQMERSLGEAGFEHVEITPTTGYWSITTARKPPGA